MTLAASYWLYFVVGASAPVLGESNTTMWLQLERAGANWSDIVECDAMNGFGVSIALATYCCFSPRRFDLQIPSSVRAISHLRPISAAALMVLLGGAAYSPLMIWRAAGLAPDAMPGGSILWRSGLLLDAGIVLVAVFASKRDSTLVAITTLLGFAQLLSGVLAASKTEALLPVAAACIGLVARWKTWRAVVAAMLFIITSFVASVAVVSQIRSAPDVATGETTSRALRAVHEVFMEPFAATAESSADALNRLCYLPAQASAIRLFRQGEGDPRWHHIAWLVVPRALAPDKPILSDRGLDFNEAMGGQRNSYASPTVFIDGVYQSGWTGLLLSGVVVGVVLGCFRIAAAVILSARAFVLLPIVAIGHYAAFRIDGGLAGDFVFPALLLFIAVALAWMWASGPLEKARGRSRARLPRVTMQERGGALRGIAGGVPAGRDALRAAGVHPAPPQAYRSVR